MNPDYMTKHRKTIEDVRASADRAELFLLKYESKLPEELGFIQIHSERACYHVLLDHRNENDRNKALAHLGDTFGRADWQAEANYNNTAFNWSKEVDDVQIRISGAQPTGQPQSFPVDPKQFPIQLEDAR